MQEEYGIKLKILTDNLKNSIMQVKGMIHNFKNDIKQDTEVNFTIDNNLTLKQLQKFKSDIESELAKLQQSSKIGAGMKVVDPDEERKIKNLTAGLTMVKERIAEIGNESEDTKQKMSGISVSANMTNNTIVNGFKNSWKSIKRFAFSLLSLRGIYGLVRKASSAYMAQDRGLAEQMQKTWASVGAMMAPIIETIVKWIRIGAAYLNYFIKALTGKDLIGKAVKKINKYNKSLGGTAKAAKSVNKELTAMDEVTNLNFDNTQGIEDAAEAFDDFGDIKLDKNVTDVLDTIANKLKKVGEFLKPVIDWAKEHPGAVLTILGGAGLLSFLGKITGKGVGSLGALAKIGVVTAGVNLIYNAVTGRDLIDDLKKIIDDLNKLSPQIKDNTKQSKENTKQNEDFIDVLDKKKEVTKEDLDLLLDSSRRRQSDNKTLHQQYLLSGALNGNWKDLNTQRKDNEKQTYKNLKALKKYYNQGKLSSDQIEDYKNRLIDEIHYLEDNYDATEMNTEQAKKYKEKVNNLKGALEDITGHKYNSVIDINTEGALSKTKGIENMLNTFKNTVYTTKVEIDKQKEADIKNKAKEIADNIKSKLSIKVTPTVDMKVGTKDAKNKITNFVTKTSSAMSFGGLLNKMNQATLKALLNAIPAYDVGTPYVPNDQLAMVHKGEAIIPKKFNNEQFFNSNNEETNALLIEVNQNLIELRNRPNVLEVNGRELAQATYNDFQNEGNRLNQSMTIKKVGGN